MNLYLIILPASFIDLKGPFHPACIARVASWLASVVTIDNDKGEPRDGASKHAG